MLNVPSPAGQNNTECPYLGFEQWVKPSRSKVPGWPPRESGGSLTVYNTLGNS
jgi:hypothetical protein